MILTPAQIATLKAAILADGTMAAFPDTSDGNFDLAVYLNVVAPVAFWVWRSAVTQAECVGKTSVDGTDWSWTQYIGRSQGERDAWREMFADTGTINPSRPNIRSGLADVFSGAATGANSPTAQRTHLLATGRRLATRVEQILATGTGSTASPGLMGAEGPITPANVTEARHS